MTLLTYFFLHKVSSDRKHIFFLPIPLMECVGHRHKTVKCISFTLLLKTCYINIGYTIWISLHMPHIWMKLHSHKYTNSSLEMMYSSLSVQTNGYTYSYSLLLHSLWKEVQLIHIYTGILFPFYGLLNITLYNLHLTINNYLIWITILFSSLQ